MAAFDLSCVDLRRHEIVMGGVVSRVDSVTVVRRTWSLGGGSKSMGAIDDLRRWYAAQCDGDWEHSYGIQIGTLDNPGWRVEIDLRDTLLEDKPFNSVEEGIGPDDSPSWLQCKVEKAKFCGHGDPGRLEQIL